MLFWFKVGYPEDGYRDIQRVTTEADTWQNAIIKLWPEEGRLETNYEWLSDRLYGPYPSEEAAKSWPSKQVF